MGIKMVLQNGALLGLLRSSTQTFANHVFVHLGTVLLEQVWAS